MCLFLFLLSITSVDCFSINMIKLPPIDVMGGAPINNVIKHRRSVRKFVANKNLTRVQIAQLLWAGQGVTVQSDRFRTVPSAGALYPIELYVVKNDGIWHYETASNSINLIINRDLRKQLAQAALSQMFIKDAAAIIVIVGVYRRTTQKYGERGIAYVNIEAGAVMQNILLETVNLGLAVTPIGAFYNQQVRQLLKLSKNQTPLLIIPIGYANK